MRILAALLVVLSLTGCRTAVPSPLTAGGPGATACAIGCGGQECQVENCPEGSFAQCECRLDETLVCECRQEADQ
jgi:hypothetical protein